MGAVLVTGATGYIGSNVCAALAAAGRTVVGLDDFSNSSPSIVDELALVAGPIKVVEADVRDRAALDAVFADHPIDSVIHLAGVKSVEESISNPLRYADINIGGSVNLIRAMTAAGVESMVFSSSCTVYGDGGGSGMALDERTPVEPVNPYGWSKAVVEQVLGRHADARSTWRSLSLRYFNPAGADATLRLGDAPKSQSRSLVPLAVEAAAGDRHYVNVFGTDYPTHDGTCIRDYLHVTDLAAAHIAALDVLADVDGHDAVNLGREEGSSVLEVIEAVERASGQRIARKVSSRRPGDATALFADASKARQMLDWKAKRDLNDVCQDAWAWHLRRPSAAG